MSKSLVTLGRSDAVLVCDAIAITIERLKEPEDTEQYWDLLQFIKIQLDSISKIESGESDDDSRT
jgi:hypothetical protein